MIAIKGQAEIIFVLIFTIIILIVASTYLSSFMQATPELRAQNDLKDTIELVCAVDGPSVSGLTIFLPQADQVTGNPKFYKLHLTTDGSLELYKCSNTGPLCSGSKQKSIVLNCPQGITFADCWVAPSAESVSVEVDKNVKRISFDQSAESLKEGVTCS